MAENYQLALDALIRRAQEEGRRPSLLLHVCCAPCGSYVLEYLSAYFDITLFFYNPNIQPVAEYEKRLGEVKKLLAAAPFCRGIELIEGERDEEAWLAFIAGTEREREGGARCTLCFEKRLEETAKLARARASDWFCTTLSISPHKNAALLNQIGERLAERYGVPFLPSDFKKRGGYQRSTELCREYDIYRQNYCGCRFSVWWEGDAAHERIK